MPLPRGTRYRYKKGTNVRLAFPPGAPMRGAMPIEAKRMMTGKTHTPAEFAAEKAKRRTKKRRRTPGQIDRAMKRGKDFYV